MAVNNIDAPTENHGNSVLPETPLDESLTPTNEWVRLNVGGTIFCTSHRTLKKYPNCFLYNLCQGPQSKLSMYSDETGALLIDRDPRYFPMFLNYMRSGRLYLCDHYCEDALIAEAEFFNIPAMLDAVKQKIKDRHLELQANSVHRVCSLKYDELSSFLSSLSDGWKLCQVLPSSNGSTYLVIVSKCFDSSPNPNLPIAAKAVKVFDDKPKEQTKHKVKSFKFM
eukprot:TRINITY_DN1997_c0_g1_i1.p1 TRINITY_DN1997_c0_g1~~TRINITY_DN1997_c0_g1_i1.p1  ORF type:complete len:224 (+),score=31.07 TRINITY_DN1997_c0_g1_i1:194-865(+)